MSWVFQPILPATQLLAGAAPTTIYVKVWDGSTWANTPANIWDGSSWVDPLAIKYWDGSTWVTLL